MEIVEVTLGELSSVAHLPSKPLTSIVGWIQYWFPEFEFHWLGEEIRENLPKEMDFEHEAFNAQHVAHDFRYMCTSLYIPEVITATKRVLVMEYIQGGRVDDLAYLAKHNIDRNKITLELSRIFNQMVFMNGWFHAGILVLASIQSQKQEVCNNRSQDPGWEGRGGCPELNSKI
jgi:aarF domain-containing kinase